MALKNHKKENSGRMFVIIVLIVVVLLGGLYAITQKQKDIAISTKVNVLKGIDLVGQPTLGDEKAPVTIVEIGDMKCPVCKQFESNQFDKIKSNYLDTGKAKMVFINFPFLSDTFHLSDDDSKRASIYGEAVYNQNKDAFWDYYKAIYKNQGDESKIWATDEFLTKLVADNIKGIDLIQLKSDVAKKETEDEITKDLAIVNKAHVTGTPSLFVNGKKIDDPVNDYDEIANTIENELGASN